MSHYDVMLFSDYFCDFVFTGLPDVPRLGAELFSTGFDIVPGGAYITVVGLHRLGVRVGWSVDFGNDLISQFVLQSARNEALDTRLFREHAFPVRHITVSFSFPHERGFITFAEDFTPPSPLPLIEEHRPRCVLLHEFPFNAAMRDSILALHRQGGRVYLDCQQIRETLDSPSVVETLRAVDIFAPNANEAMQLTDAATPEDALDQLAELTPLVIVKCGAEGAIAKHHGCVLRSPAIPVQVVDTTGAGDSFNAGFLSAYLRHEPLEMCLRVGNICGGLSTTARGGASAAPTKAQVEAWLKR